MNKSTHYFKLLVTLIPIMLLTGCFEGAPPAESDVAAIAQDYLEKVNAIGGWNPIEVHVSNLKCNRSGDAYACSFDLQGKMQRKNRWNGEVNVSDFSHKA